jgi:hypothetical protein
MSNANRTTTRGVLLLIATLIAPPAFSQSDFTGVWGARYHEDQPERIPGPALVDFVGLPMNESARRFALSWDSQRLAAPEHQCQVHTAAYIYRGPLQLRIWEERDPISKELVAIKQYINTYEQERTIWMDGRPHPSANAPHTWMGFSTGEWNGSMLTVTTTHIKQGWYRRNGFLSSDRVTLREHFVRHGDQLVHISVAQDPDYLEEPLIKSENFVLTTTGTGNWLWPCEYVVESADRKPGDVPHYLPGENPFVSEFADKYGVPVDAMLGGAKTMYPEYQKQLGQPPAKAAGGR